MPTHLHVQNATQGPSLSGVKLVWILSFPFPRPVATPRLKSLVCGSIYPSLEGEQLDSYHFHKYKRYYGKFKQPRPGLELLLSCPFPTESITHGYILSYIYIYIYIYKDQSAEVEENTNCFSAEDLDSSNECPGYMTLNNLMVRL